MICVRVMKSITSVLNLMYVLFGFKLIDMGCPIIFESY